MGNHFRRRLSIRHLQNRTRIELSGNRKITVFSIRAGALCLTLKHLHGYSTIHFLQQMIRNKYNGMAGFAIRLVLCMAGCIQYAAAQYTVRIEIEKRPQKHAEESFFITGNFNRWVPADAKLEVKEERNTRYAIELKDVKEGLLEYKFNRGSWQKLECTPDGKLADPHNAIIQRDTVIRTVIHGWRDDYPAATASPQVHLLDSSFFIPQLNTHRTVWIYLPKDYNNSGKKYPVLYMHDGQALFDEATSQGRTGPVEWGVDETIDKSGKGCIVVAVNHNPDKNLRIQEYYVHSNPDFDTVYGKQYLEFIVKTLKPHIDKNYRTLRDKKNTFMSGSSMGGLITLYAGLLYPDVFGSLGVLSPSVWLDYDHNYKEIEKLKPSAKYNAQRYYFYAGGNENRMKKDSSYVEMHNDVKNTVQAIKKKISPEIQVAVNPEGRHGPWYWSLAFPAFYEWLMVSYK